MQFLSSPDFWFFFLAAAFISAYLLYFFKVVRLASILGRFPGKILVKLIFRTVYFSLLLFALLGPSFGEQKSEVKTISKDIFIAVDLSKSMNANDISPSRLERVKFELKNLVEKFSGEKIGLIIFSGQAFMHSPLTYDQSMLNLLITTLNTGLISSAGTDFGPPLQMAIEKHMNESEKEKVDNSAKVIILISDGEDFGDNTDEALEDIVDEGIKLYTLGVGTESGAPIPEGRGFKTQDGKQVISSLNSSSLKKLAKETDGQYFEINDERNDIEKMINTIEDIKGQLRETRKMDVEANKYYYFLLIALGLALIDLLIKTKLFSFS